MPMLVRLPAVASLCDVTMPEAPSHSGTVPPLRPVAIKPVTPVYAELSEILQVHLHRVLTRQEEPREGLLAAASAMRQILKRSGLGDGE